MRRRQVARDSQDNDEQERECWAVRVDDTQFLNKEFFKEKFGHVPLKCYSVYATDRQRTYIASTTPSVWMMCAYAYCEWPKKTPKDVIEQAEADMGSDDDYFDWRNIEQKIEAGPPNARSIGKFETVDDAREYLAGNWVL